MPQKYIKVDYQDRIIPGRLYRVETALEVPLPNFPNLETMLTNFQSRLRSRLGLESLGVTKGLITEEKAEIFIFISFGRSEATKSLWENWKVIEWQLSAIGVPKLVNVDIEVPQLPIDLGQAETGLVEQVKQWVQDWHGLIEIILLLVIIAILLNEKQD